MSENEKGNTFLEAALKQLASDWLAFMEKRVTASYHFLADVSEDEMIMYDKYLSKGIEILESETVPLPAAISTLRSKREFVRILMYCRTEVANRCPRPSDPEAAKEAINDEHLAWLMRRQPEQ